MATADRDSVSKDADRDDDPADVSLSPNRSNDDE